MQQNVNSFRACIANSGTRDASNGWTCGTTREHVRILGSTGSAHAPHIGERRRGMAKDGQVVGPGDNCCTWPKNREVAEASSPDSADRQRPYARRNSNMVIGQVHEQTVLATTGTPNGAKEEAKGRLRAGKENISKRQPQTHKTATSFPWTTMRSATARLFLALCQPPPPHPTHLSP